MSFTRTNSGLSNNRLFSGVDIVVYTEGGSKSYSLEDVENGKFNNQSVDIKFWSGIFKAAGFNKKVKFKALGSKNSSSKIYEKIISGKIKNVAIALDRDMDFILSSPKLSPFVLYTNGYSWENDVYTEKNTLAQINSLLMEQTISEDIKHEVYKAYKDFNHLGRKLIKLECIYRSNNIKFMTDIKGERFFDNRKYCSVNKVQVVNFISEKRKKIKKRPLFTNVDFRKVCTEKDIYGKLLSCLSINIITYICKKHSSHKSLPNLFIESNMMERFIQEQNVSCNNYYKKIVKNLEVA
ncbi:hypothetical protein AB6D86_00600 [Vibrio splendidus]